MILLIDNYDSFTYNLVQLIGSICKGTGSGCAELRVVRNDKISAEEIERLSPSHLILSPGPGRPADAGICETAVREFTGRIPILGVCLGHQAIGEGFGAKITYAKTLMHRNSLPDGLKVTAETSDGEIMAVEYRSAPVFGLQFHPESVLTPDGGRILKNFLAVTLSC